MKQIQSLRLPYEKDPDLNAAVARELGIEENQISSIRVIKRSLDARHRRQFYWIYSLEVFFQGEVPQNAFEAFPKLKFNGPPPLILGAGPAGLFAAWTFIQHGIRPILFERGERTHERMRRISLYWRKGILDPDSNVCNGEGGAGTFSDGKLITRIKSPHIDRVMDVFVKYGAPAEIAYVANPHVGSNLIREVIRKMSDDLIEQDADLRFQTRVEGLDLHKNQVQGVRLADGNVVKGTGLIMASGHSAGEFFKTLSGQGVVFQAKPFALGLRIEHAQEFINRWQYGQNAPEELGSAAYKLTHHWDQDHTGVYTFCMCPGGYVVSSTTDDKTIVVNGMSNYHRNSPWANAAVVCSVGVDRVEGNDPFKMMHFQRDIERKVYEASLAHGDGRSIPAQNLEDFFEKRPSTKIAKSSCPSGAVPAELSSLLPDWIYRYLSDGIHAFDKKRQGFAHPTALLHAVESRTSSPVRIERNAETLESLSTQGLFPCGEGPGYAGGITSAAVDGIRAALGWISKFAS